jgi:adenylate cyclase
VRVATKRRISLLLRELVVIAVGGAILGSVAARAPLIGAVAGALDGVLSLGAIVGAEVFLPVTRLGRSLDRAPFLVGFAVKSVAYFALLLVVIGPNVGRRLATAVLPPPDALGQQPPAMTPTLAIVVAALFVPAFVLVVQMSRLIGQRMLRDIVLGRYHQPRAEDRFFLFVDIAGSTPLAERIGPAAVHRFLSQVFWIASAPIEEHGGEVYQYVGDEIVITWTAAEAPPQARPLACFFAVEQALARAAPQFDHDFGAAPRLRAALHAGPVIAGEVGDGRRAIVYHGDVMNTASRLEAATRDVDRQFLVSGDALERLGGVEAYAIEDLGPQRLRGRVAELRVYAVTAKAPSEATRRASGHTLAPGPSR